MSDPILGSITASEAAALQAKWVAAKAALGAFEQALVAAIVTDPPSPVVEPEPPIEEPPSMPEWGCDEGIIDATWDVGPGGDTPGDKAIKASLANGTPIRNKRILGGGGYGACVTSDSGPSVSGPRIDLINCLLLPADYGSKQWGTRMYGRPILYDHVTVVGPEPTDFAEGHPFYDSPRDFWKAIKCVTVKCAGNIQLTYRPSEGVGPCHFVDAELLILDGHRPMQNGEKSDQVGPLFAIYNLAADCEAVVRITNTQHAWPAWGPWISCVPGLGAGEVYAGEEGTKVAWWKPGDVTHGYLDFEISFIGKRPLAQELFKGNGIRKTRGKAQIKFTDSNAPIRVLIDPPFHYGAQCQEIELDLDVRGPDGQPIACPIERNGVVVAYTTDGVYTSSVPIGTH